ncbi:MAG: DUF4982 domain-containing protein [Faecalicatena sp.]|uniref:glycoside hydrolase family 2 TIM barrel-domain containing protein n=1 Tax=Faecalicatena sp. TaxID=2005360 RepID=UPI0025845971|nr:glycoside hydrolase family 2 TIM barrel-domain containing protein [Faecalicatena sp.]MCI6464189.1 DUF4982 domain-containing protein [Faecalicatena sp.]MDY5621155.1 glycoside hydrolase family 2 TIM barrel-domain containing protein [Lachnospiraceae bacterium]
MEMKFNDNWKFWIEGDSFALVWNIPDIAREVTLPHDAMIEKPAHEESLNGGNTGYRDGDVYNYVKLFQAPEEYKDKTVMLKFEGVYMNAFVYVNGQLAGKNPFGYTTFYVPLNNFLRFGQENEIRVQVRNGAMTNSRWYSGGGIYRDVYLLVSDLVHIVPEGVQVKTESADEEYAVLHVDTELENCFHTPAELVLETVIQDAAGNTAAQDRTLVTVFAQDKRKMSQRMTVVRPEMWSAESPALYTCVTCLIQDGTVIDKSKEKFGIRTLSLDAKRGLRVNGSTVKLRGACIHHDSGLLGAATYDSVQFRQIRKLKEAGFNAVRMSHHPMAPAMLRACDELGMYVMDETFDMWNRCKSNYDYGLYFQEWWEKDVTAMVRKDFNHPSVILYSVGNEIPEIGTDHGAKICHDLSSKIKELDDTRFTLASINGVFAAGDQVDRIVADVVSDLSKAGKIDGNVNDFMTLMDGHMDEIVVHNAITERLERACAGVDIAGYNYMTARYEMDGEKYPNRVIVGSETYPPEIARNWNLVEKLDHVIGDFTWTGWDYIGEAGVGVPAYQWGEGGFGAGFPCQLAYPGDLDITGFRRPASYYREAVFGLSTKPYIAVQDPNRYGQQLIKTPWVISDTVSSWTWGGCDGKPVVVEVYSQGKETELFINGKSCGRKPAGKAAGFRTLFETTYEPGTILAVSYDEDGNQMGQMELHTAGEDRNLVLTAEPEMKDQFIYIDAVLCDQDGNTATDSDMKITLDVEGCAEAVGFGSGNPKPKYNFNEGVTETFHGRAQIVLMRTGSGKVQVKVSAEDGKTAELNLI